MPRIISIYKRPTPADVARWEQEANTAASDTEGLLRLTYHLALQVRSVKLLLIWTLLVIPIVAAVFLFVLPEVLQNSGSNPF